MAYNKFKKLEQLEQILGVKDIMHKWLPKEFHAAKVSHKLLDALEDAENEHLDTEKAKSEFVITPILKELRRNNPNKFSTFSGYAFEVDSSKDLNGFCDFILSAAANRSEIVAPIFCLVEAKNDNVNRGLAQCGQKCMQLAFLSNKKVSLAR